MENENPIRGPVTPILTHTRTHTHTLFDAFLDSSLKGEGDIICGCGVL